MAEEHLISPDCCGKSKRAGLGVTLTLAGAVKEIRIYGQSATKPPLKQGGTLNDYRKQSIFTIDKCNYLWYNK